MIVGPLSSLVYEAAKDDGCETLLDSFRPEYISHAFAEEVKSRGNRNKTPKVCAKKLLSKLKRAVAAVDKANELHDNMDVGHFNELVLSDNVFVTSGVDREKGRKIIFFRLGKIYTGIWRYKSGSPRANAFVAAFNFWFRAAIANIPLDAKGDELQTLIISDVSESGCLDFHPQLQAQAMKMCVDMLSPLPPLVLIAGAPTISRIFMNITLACIPEEERKNVVNLAEHKDIERFIGPDDTPSWWYDEESPNMGVPHQPCDPRTNWQYAASAKRGYSVSLAEIWKPGPWLDNVEKRRLPEPRKALSTLGTIEEDSEDEW